MNDELQKALATILAKTTNALEAGVTFLQAELPEVIRQLLAWHAVKSGITFAVCVILFAACATVAVKCFKAGRAKLTDDDGDDGFGEFVVFLFGSLSSCAAGSSALNNLDWLQILIAPKLYLIEYAARLAK